MKRFLTALLTILLAIGFTACHAEATKTAETTETAQTAPVSETTEMQQTETTGEEAMKNLTLRIDGKEVAAIWEENESVTALKALVKEAPLTVDMEKYGGFEQVGALGSTLPRKDVPTKTQPGDIVLYSGNQIVIFYGSNSWDYTRLGKIDGLNEQELKALLGGENVTLTVSLE